MTGKIASAFAIAALFAHSWAVYCPFSVPKVLVLALGAAVLAFSMGEIRESKTVPAGLLFLAVCALSALFAADKPLAVFGSGNSYALGLMGLSIAFIYHLGALEGVPTEPLALAGVVIGLHALAQYAGLAWTKAYDGGRAMSTMGSPVDLGTVLAMILPIGASRSMVYAAAIGLGIMATGSRGAVLAGAAGLVAYRVRP